MARAATLSALSLVIASPSGCAPSGDSAETDTGAGLDATPTDGGGCDDADTDPSADVCVGDASVGDAGRAEPLAECPEGGAGPCPPALPDHRDAVCAHGRTVAVDDVSLTVCEPPSPAESCGAGQFPAPVEGGCIEQAPGCLADGERFLPSEVLDVLAAGRPILFVDPDADSTVGIGTRELPLPTIEAALSELGVGGAGGVVALSRGVHAGATIAVSDVALVGACPEQTTITSTVESITSGALTVLAPGAVVTGLTLTGPALGVVVLDGGTLELTDVIVAGAHRVGVKVDGAGSSATLHRVWIRDTEPTLADHSFGRGLQVSGGASVRADTVTVSDAYEVGVLAIGDGTSLEAGALLVRDVANDWLTDQGSAGVQALDGSAVSGTDWVIERVGALGVSVSRSASATLDRVVVREVRYFNAVAALRVGRDSTVTVDDLQVTGADARCAFVEGTGARLEADGAVLTGCTGVAVDDLGSVAADWVLLDDVSEGLVATNGGEVQATSLACRATGSCVAVAHAGVVSVAGATLESATEAAVTATDAQLSLRDARVWAVDRPAIQTVGEAPSIERIEAWSDVSAIVVTSAAATGDLAMTDISAVGCTSCDRCTVFRVEAPDRVWLERISLDFAGASGPSVGRRYLAALVRPAGRATAGVGTGFELGAGRCADDTGLGVWGDSSLPNVTDPASPPDWELSGLRAGLLPVAAAAAGARVELAPVLEVPTGAHVLGEVAVPAGAALEQRPALADPPPPVTP
ncbi:MAG: hypothetical protein H6697_10950 [Myxococcales bacterium]|nr:hypothetical protein [Myxococcales bacterium]